MLVWHVMAFYILAPLSSVFRVSLSGRDFFFSPFGGMLLPFRCGSYRGPRWLQLAVARFGCSMLPEVFPRCGSYLDAEWLLDGATQGEVV